MVVIFDIHFSFLFLVFNVQFVFALVFGLTFVLPIWISLFSSFTFVVIPFQELTACSLCLLEVAVNIDDAVTEAIADVRRDETQTDW